ncbi:MAG TPA: CoA-binding protein [Candidatus Polarisedimenticolia bacterium]|nr:CoA-binding protein [Candidatus Polarisedimenticolia bacterium]
MPVLDDAAMLDVLRRARRIAVIGASSKPYRASNGVMRTLMRAGYDCVPVHPNEPMVNGIRAFPTLDAAVAETGPFDIVDVFRRAEFCPEHAHEAVRTGAGCLWLQLGIVSWEAAEVAHAGGLGVVMDRCTQIELGRIRG